MKTAEFKQLIASQKEEWVLVDFWAKWCAPCKKITAYLPEIEKEFAGKISIVKINYDDNPRLVKELGLDNVPYLFLYKKGTEQWKNSGYIEKEALRAALNKGL
jgi:thioredoxin